MNVNVYQRIDNESILSLSQIVPEVRNRTLGRLGHKAKNIFRVKYTHATTPSKSAIKRGEGGRAYSMTLDYRRQTVDKKDRYLAGYRIIQGKDKAIARVKSYPLNLWEYDLHRRGKTYPGKQIFKKVAAETDGHVRNIANGTMREVLRKYERNTQ